MKLQHTGADNLTEVQRVTVQFMAVAMAAVAFLVVAQENGYFRWWEWL